MDNWQLTSSLHQNAPARGQRSYPAKRGIALLLVLVGVAILTVMILSLCLDINSELQSSKIYAHGASVKLLGQTAVNLVMAEIYQATSGCTPGTTNDGSTLAWASEPGMIRTYDTTGAPAQYYKLYSDSAMTGTGAFNHTQGSLVPDGNNGTVAWYNQKGVYIDLNEPTSVNGTNQYPILDGDLDSTDLVSMPYPNSNTLPTLTTPTSSDQVTMMGPTLPSGYPEVAGFWLNSNTPVNPSSPNQAPMPVKWLYILRDGKIAVPDTDITASSIVTFTNSTIAPSSSDPIVGRIAFWTDDETSKVNINTASEGAYNSTTNATSFNDTPRVCTPFDLNLAQCPSWQNEFQRYPGHPATVSLSTVFGNLTTTNTYPENVYSTTNNAGIAPRTIGGGSTEATVSYATTASKLSTLSNRLYATPDEIMLQPSRSVNSKYITQAALKRAEFFITANSRAPDVNLFNLPRICVWPISAKGAAITYQTAFDQLIAFCTTIAGEPYYFQRSDWTSQTEWQTISGSPVGGAGRNQTLLTYLQYLCGQYIPGFGGSTFAAKYNATNGSGGTELNQIFMEIFDYIRSTNIYDSSLTAGDQFNPTTPTPTPGYGFGEVVPSYDTTNDTKGFGRYPIISKAGILFIASGTSSTNQQQVIGGTAGGTLTYGPAVASGKVRVQAALLFQLFDPAQGYTALVPDCNIKIVNSTLTWNISSTGQTASNASSPMFPNAAGTVYPTSGTAQQSVAWGGNLGTLPFINAYWNSDWLSLVPSPTYPTSTAANPFPDFNVGGPIMFTGSVEAQVVTTNSGNVVQDITFTFPADSVTTPTYVPATPTWTYGSTYMEQMSNFAAVGTNIEGRLSYNGNSTYLTLSNFWPHFVVTSSDVMQGIQCTTGDLRLVAGHAKIPPSGYTYSPALFGPNPNYGAQFAHNFVDAYGMPWYGATRGQLVSGVTSYWSSASSSVALATPFTLNSSGGSNDPAYLLKQSGNINPIQTCEPEGFGTTTNAAAQGVTAGSTASWTSSQPQGDFDNGTGAVRDGPYINKADEGGLLSNSNYVPYFMDSGTSYTAIGTAYFSPAREMPSAVMLGSLSTGVIGNKPWQTLLFHPDPTGLHAGAQAPMDHLLLDLFTMPVVEPYAISEPLSTAGRINMNYLIVPFTYINRDTGVRAVLESQQMLAVPNADSGSNSTITTTYKQMVNSSSAPTFSTAPKTLRYSINLDETMKGFINRFYPQAINSSSTATPDIFRSPSEICTLPLVPNDTSSSPTYTNIATYWQSHQLTGDNSRERPYANIYPLLTTKSNTFTIHFRVQTLQPLQGSAASPTTWREGTDAITGEYRGSQTIERYVDPNVTLPDYAAASNPTSSTPLSSYYRFRVVSTKQFSP